MSEREELDDLGMVCDAYGLPHSAVALARHLTNGADHTISVWRDTCRVLEERLDNAAAEALAPVLALADRLDGMGMFSGTIAAYRYAAAEIRAAAGTPTRDTTEEETP